MERLVWIAQTKFDCGPSKPPRPGGLSPMDIVKSVRELSEKLVSPWGGGQTGCLGCGAGEPSTP
jgi:hypothetical protein